jgi:hypothetical protein
VAITFIITSEFGSEFMATIKDDSRRVTHQAGPAVETLARLGYAARGIVYGLIGVLALQAAVGSGSTNVDQTTVFKKILSQPFGQFLLWVIIIGLIGYALWRLILALFDLEGDGRRKGGTLKRVGYFISAVSYLVLAYIAYNIMKTGGSGSAGGSNSTTDITAKVLSMPGGTLIIGLIGLILIGVGLYGIYLGFSSKMEKRFDWGRMPNEERRMAIRLGRIGYAARGVVYALIGIFLVQAAMTYNPSKAQGLGGALTTLASQPYGKWALIVVAVGLIAFGIYALALARYRRINV